MRTSIVTILTPAQLDQLSINTIRFLSIDAVQKANSGHPGLPLGAAPMACVLWTRFLQHNPINPHWFNRDRFVLSAGHGSMLLYSLLYLTGYELSLDQIKQFRQWGSQTPGHPERGLTPGVETTTGPLGQGFGNGVGMAIAEAYLAARYNRPGFDILHHYTYGLVSDGDLMEGVAAEAASLAGHLKLGKLIYLYDDNHITLAAATQLTFTEDRVRRFEAYGWHTQSLDDGNDVEAIDRAIRAAQQETERPSLILVRTHIGYGSPHKQDTFAAHGSPLGKEEVTLTKENLGWPVESPFLVPDAVEQHCRQAVHRGRQAEAEWNEKFAAYKQRYPELARELRLLIKGELPPGWDANIPHFPADAKGLATRVASGKIMQAISQNLPGLIGGSADLNPSTYTELTDAGNFESSAMAVGDLQGSAGGGGSYAGRNLQFGVREHAMGAIVNGHLFSSEELGELFERLGYPFEYETIPRNIAYYAARASHGSTLCRVVYAWVLARSDRPRAMDFFAEALQSDVSDVQQGTTAEGIHLGAMAGTVDLVQRVSTGIEVRGNVLRLNPELPREMERLDMRIRYRGHSLDLRLTRDSLTVRGRDGAAAPISLCVDGKVCEFVGGTTRVFRLNDEATEGVNVEKDPADGRERHHDRPDGRVEARHDGAGGLPR